MIGQTLSHFHITSKLGEGGMGEVWLAEDTKLGREVAIKILPEAFVADPERLARFEREARVLASLNHQNIAGIYEVGESEVGESTAGDSKIHFLAMELAEGEDLSERLAQGPMSIEDALRVAAQLAEALEAAHEKGIIHRDLKPQNIKLSAEGEVKVLDFGLAKALEGDSNSAPSSPQLTHSPTMTLGGTMEGVILGTAAYMSPEQAKGQAADKRADIWAFGVVVWEMLTGRRLFSAETAPETLARVLTAEPDLEALPEATPTALRRLLRRALQRKPQDRLRDIGDARLVLADIESGVEDETPDDSVTVDTGSSSGRVRESIVWTVAALALLAAGWIYFARPPAGGSAPRVIRSILPLPEGVTIELDGTRAGMPKLSPDGTRIAFGGRRGAEPLRIWVQDLATSETHPLPGTDSGYRPFWSPDGRNIGFFTWSNLSTTPSGGGPVTKLAPARDARGGTWGSNGKIVYTPHSWGPIRIIPENGGNIEFGTLLAPDSSTTHRFPSFLPDSEHYLFLDRTDAARLGTEEVGIAVGRVGSTEPTRLLSVPSNAIYRNGYLLYVKDTALVAQPFDPDGLALSGEPRVLVDDLLINRRFTYGVFTASDNGVLAFLTGRQQDLSRMVWRDREGRELGQLGGPMNMSGYGGLAISPDGAWAAAALVDASTTGADIWLFDLKRGTETRIGGADTDEYNVIFSPDSKALFYGNYLRADSSIVRRDLANGEETIVFTSDTGHFWAPMFVSPDGQWLVADRRGRFEEDSDLVQVALDGSGQTQALIEGPDDTLMSQISPDGRWLAWVSDRSGRHEIYAARYPGLEARSQISRNGGTEPRWSRDGTELLYKGIDNWVVTARVEQVSGTLAIGEPERLFQLTEFDGPTYAVGAEEGQFLTREPLAEQDTSPITILTDWPALLEQ